MRPTEDKQMRDAKPFVDDSIFFEVKGKRYVAWRNASNVTFSAAPTKHQDFILATVILTSVLPSLPVDAAALKRLIESWLVADDVFDLSFLEVIVFQDPAGNEVDYANEELKGVFNEWGTTLIARAPENAELYGGPHIAIGGELFVVRRLFDDSYTTMVCTTRQDSPR